MLADAGRGADQRPHAPQPGSGGLFSAAGDAVALAYLVVVLIVTVMFDGGLDEGALPLLSGVALLTAPIMVLETARSSPATRTLLFALGIGLLASLAFAVHRADLTEALLAYSLPVVAFLTARRLLRRPWGGRAVLGLLGVAAAAYWFRAFILWLEPPFVDLRSNWLAVLWHNPSAALMATFGMFATATALATPKRRRAGAATAAASLLFAGLWLTGSRGALIAAVLGFVVVVLASRGQGPRRLSMVALGIAAGTTLAVVVLLQAGGIRGGTGAEVLASRGTDDTGLVRVEEGAGGTLRARLAHMDAALDLFVDHPVTGAGLGSYGELGNLRASPGANLTRSAHNEFVEVLAEGGLLLGIPFLVAGAAMGILALRRVRTVHPADGALMAALTAGASGATVLLLVHVAVDIDWRYPVIPGLLAVSAALLMPQSRLPIRTGRGLAVTPVVVALVLGAGTSFTETALRQVRLGDDSEIPLPAAPWDSHRRTEAARQLARTGDLATARRVLAPAGRWNPGSPKVPIMRDVVDHRAGELSSVGLVRSLDGRRSGALGYVWVAESLLDREERALAGDVIAEGLALTDEHDGTPFARAELFELAIRHAASTQGCDAARDVADERSDDAQTLRYVDDLSERLQEALDDVC